MAIAHQPMKPITLQTPNAIEVLIHCHCCPEPHPRIDAPAVRDALQCLQECGAITTHKEPGRWMTTALGAAWLHALCRVPIPTTRKFFVDADGGLLGEFPDV
jgi:hypothetical protein